MIFPEYVLDQLVAAIDAGKHVILTGPRAPARPRSPTSPPRSPARPMFCTGLPADHRHHASGRPSRPSAASSPPPTA